MDEQKIANEIRAKGFAVAKCAMNDEAPEEWVLFGVWFFLKQNFYIDLDWRTGKYYFYIDSGKDAVKAKELKNKSFDTYSAEDFLSNNLLKHYSKLNEIAKVIDTKGIFVTDDISVIQILDISDYRSVLNWIVTETDTLGVIGVVNKELPLMMLTIAENQEKITETANANGLKTHMEKLDDWLDDNIEVEKVDGFEDMDFYC